MAFSVGLGMGAEAAGPFLAYGGEWTGRRVDNRQTVSLHLYRCKYWPSQRLICTMRAW